MFFVYVLKNEQDKSWYVGYTRNIKRRVKEHISGKGCRTTSIKNEWKLIYFECYINKKDALGREKFLKGGSGRMYIRKQLKHYFSQKKSS